MLLFALHMCKGAWCVQMRTCDHVLGRKTAINQFVSIPVSVYMENVYLCMCVCVCVCVYKPGGEGELCILCEPTYTYLNHVITEREQMIDKHRY